MEIYDVTKASVVLNNLNDKNFLKKVDYYKEHFSDLNILINLKNNELTQKNINYLFELLNQLDLNNINVYFELNETPFTKKEFRAINKFNNLLKSKSKQLMFKENTIMWTFDEIKNTYKTLYTIVDKSKLLTTPFDKLMFYYKNVADRIYFVDENDDLSKLKSSSVYGVTNYKDIRCVGFTMLLKYLIALNNDKNLKCYSARVIINKNGKEESHRVNYVYINDEKIRGLYYLDATWGSKENEKDVMNLSFFMIPLNDIKLFSNIDLRCDEISPFCYFTNDFTPNCCLPCVNTNVRNTLADLSIINLENARENFKQNILEKCKTKSADYVLKMQNYLKSNKSFSNARLEYSFLKSVCNKIKTLSFEPDYDLIINALWQTCLVCYDMDFSTAKTYIEQVIAKTKQCSFKSFVPGAKNCFAVLSKIEYSKKQAREQEIEQIKQQKVNKNKKEDKIIK